MGKTGLIIGAVVAVIAIAVIIILAIVPYSAKILQPNAKQPQITPAPLQNYSVVRTSQCVSVNGLPDPTCTPGEADPAVTQENIHQTICVSGYTATVRPPVSVTEPMKLESMRQYGYSDSPSNYEYDHLIPLELGGASTVKNLWPEAYHGAYNSYSKDAVENGLKKDVCSGAISLSTAQKEIAHNWIAVYIQLYESEPAPKP